MELFADESVDAEIVERLRRDGHHVDYIAEMSPGLDDNRVLAEANGRQAILFTADKGFGDMVVRRKAAAGGIVLLRLHGLTPELKADVVSSAVAAHGSEMKGAVAVVQAGLVRIRAA